MSKSVLVLGLNRFKLIRCLTSAKHHVVAVEVK